MATTLALGDIFKVAVEVQLTVQTCVMDLHYRVTAIGIASITDQQYADGLTAAVAAAFKPVIPNNSVYWGIRLQILKPTLQPGVFSRLGTGAGTGGANSSPSQVAAVVSKYTSLAGRKGRGRIFVGPVPAVFVDSSGNMTGAGLTAYGGIATFIMTVQSVSSGANSATGTPTLFHKSTGTSTDLTASIATGKFGTQRRRGNYGQANAP